MKDDLTRTLAKIIESRAEELKEELRQEQKRKNVNDRHRSV